MDTGIDIFRDIMDNVKKSKKINKNEVIKMSVRTGENLRIAIEEIEQRYEISQRKATIAMVEYGTWWIYTKYHQKIADIYEYREKIRHAKIDKPDSLYNSVACRLMDSLKVYVNDLTNIKPINVSLWRKDYDYLGGVARALSSDLSSILRLTMYVAADAEGIKLFEGEITRFVQSLDINKKILEMLQGLLEC